MYRTGIFRNSKKFRERSVTFFTFCHFLEVNAWFWLPPVAQVHSSGLNMSVPASPCLFPGPGKGPPRKTPLGPDQNWGIYAKSVIFSPEPSLNGMLLDRFYQSHQRWFCTCLGRGIPHFSHFLRKRRFCRKTTTFALFHFLSLLMHDCAQGNLVFYTFLQVFQNAKRNR